MERCKPRPRPVRLIEAVACGAVAAFATGCGGDLATISGSVSFDGAELSCGENTVGVVVFQHTEGGPKAIGGIDESGRYRAEVGDSKYVLPGEYSVTVTAREVIPSADPNFPPKMKTVIPVRYASAMSAGLRFDVAKGSNTIDIALSSN